MKLRISGQSIRLRLLRSEVAQLVERGCVEETIYLGLEENSFLTYVLLVEDAATEISLRYTPFKIAIILPKQLADTWAAGEQVGIYASVDLGARGIVDLIVEKDFACLDLSDEDNQDTFPNPQIGTVC